MAIRWRILGLLFAVRTAMAFQFQAPGALGPLLRAEYGVGLGDLGLLIGLYLSPGIVLALPAGGLGRRFGDKACVLAGLALMAAGGLAMALLPGWGAQLGGRLLAGFGGVLMNVLMTKMVTDWFAGREIATAMGLYVNSWPVGIAVALLAMPWAGAVLGIGGAYLMSVTATLLAALPMLAWYRAPADLRPPGAASGAPGGGALGGGALGGRAALAVILAGLTWGLFNAAVAMVFSFGNSLLAERGWTLAAAGAATSLVLWLAVVSVPAGGLLADRTGRPGIVVVGSGLAFAALLGLATRTDAVLPVFVALGLVGGLSAGPIMALPSRVLTTGTRAIGMGGFWTLFYLVVVAAPWLGGRVAASAGSAAAAFDLGVAMLLLGCATYGGFVVLERGAAAQILKPL